MASTTTHGEFRNTRRRIIRSLVTAWYLDYRVRRGNQHDRNDLVRSSLEVRLLPNGHRMARALAPLCAICWEQLNDFIWVSFVQVALLAFGAVDGLFFVIEEVLLFFVLIVIKHRVRPILGRITEIS